MVTMVTRYTGGLSQLPVVEMGKNTKKNLVFTTFLVFWPILSDTLVYTALVPW